MEHGHAGAGAFLSPGDYCNQGADIDALGLRNGNGMEFAGKGYGCKTDERGMTEM